MRSGELAAITTAAGSSVRAALGERVERRVGPEERDPPAALAQREAEDDERQIVLLPRRTGQESARPGTLIPAAGEAEEPSP